jgi:hypothetical protein
MLQKTAEHVSASSTAAATVPTAAAAPMALTGKLALVTGASSGIGLAIAKMFVAEGEHRRTAAPPSLGGDHFSTPLVISQAPRSARRGATRRPCRPLPPRWGASTSRPT